VISALAAAALSACVGPPPALTQVLEARRLASELHVEFAKAAEAANRAVMAATEEASTAAADESRRARTIVERDVEALQPILQSLGYREDLGYLDAFKTEFAEYRRLDDEILPLAVENSNVKAQRLSFGRARDAADAFRAALDAAVGPRAGHDSCCAEALAAKARIGVLEIQVMQAPHIAESDDAVMDRIEMDMKNSEGRTRKALAELKAAPAIAALDRFMAVNSEIVTLSRRNSNVRSLALSLGRKRTVAAACEDQLQALEQALAKHRFSATR
jgi:hypothetical protein